MKDVESLQALVVRRAREIGGREGEISNRALARRNGAELSHTLISQIVNGEYANRAPGHRILEGLSLALEVPLQDVERAAGAPPSYGPFQLPEDAARLTPMQRRAVKQVVEAMLDPGAVVAMPTGSTARGTRTRVGKGDADVVTTLAGRAARTGTNRGKARRALQDKYGETPPPLPEDEP